MTVDGGEPIGVLPLGEAWAVEPGRHRVEGKGAKGEAASREVSVAAGQTVAVHLVSAEGGAGVAAVPAPAPIPAPTGESPAPVGSPTGSAAPAPAGDTSASTAVHASSTRTWVTVGLGAVAVGALAAGIGFEVASQNAGNDAQSLRASLDTTPGACNGASAGCAQLKSDADAENRNHTLGIAFYTGAGVFAAGAMLSWLLLPKTTEGHASLAPMIGPRTAGAQCTLSF